MVSIIFSIKKIVLVFLLMLVSYSAWSQDAKLQKRILSIAEKFMDRIIPDVSIRKKILPDTPVGSGYAQQIHSKENFLAKKTSTKNVFSISYNFLFEKDTIGSVAVLVDTLSNSVQLQAMTIFDEHSFQMIKGYSLVMANKFHFGYSNARKYALQHGINRKPFLFCDVQPVFIENKTGCYIKVKYFWILTRDNEKEQVSITLDTENGKVLEEVYRHKGKSETTF